MNTIKIKRLSETAIMPTYGSEQAACMDLYADVSYPIHIAPHITVKIGCGFAFQPPKGYCGLIFARSGTATKQGLRPANCVGVCDEDYRGEYIVAVHNDTEMTQTVNPYERIAQVMFVPYEQFDLVEVEELGATERNDGGFGSTGV